METLIFTVLIIGFAGVIFQLSKIQRSVEMVSYDLKELVKTEKVKNQ